MQGPPPVSYSNPRDIGQLHEPLKSIIYTVTLDAPRHGLILVSGKRTDYMQWLLRHERCPGHEYGPMSQYPGNPRTAIPGTSHHRNLTPIIAAADMGGIDLDWLISVEDEYGISRVVKGEKWHYEVTHAPTRRIIPYGSTHPDVPVDPNKGHHWVVCGPGDFDGEKGPIYKRGGYNNQIAEIQIRLSKLQHSWHDRKLDPGTIDGKYGTKDDSPTRKAVLHFSQLVKVRVHPAGWPTVDDPAVGQKKIDMLRWFTA